MRFILVFLLFIFTQSVLSQDTLYKISGKVIDDKTKQPIANVGGNDTSGYKGDGGASNSSRII